MKRILILLVMLLFIPYTSFAEELPNSYIVIVQNEEAEDKIKEIVHPIDEFELGPSRYFVLETNLETVKELKANKLIRYYEENHVVQKTETVSGSSTQVIPWGLRQIEADRLFDIACKCRIAIIDTGIATHPDLDHAIKDKVTFLNGQETVGQATDDSRDGHGTHIAGTIAAKNNTFGVVGILESAELYIAKALDSNGDGYTSDIAKAIQWAVDRNVDVINLSLGTASSSYVLEQAIIHAVNKGTVIVAASGNNGGAVHYPASSTYTIAVSAMDEQRRLTSWSSFGSQVDILAPGSNIFSTGRSSNYLNSSGTSMATPHVTATIAKLLNQYSGPKNSSRTDWARQQIKLYSDEAYSTTGHLLPNVGSINLYRSFHQVPFLTQSVTVQLANSQTTMTANEFTTFADPYRRIRVQTNTGVREFQIK